KTGKLCFRADTSFEGFDAVIHLAGEPLTLSRWSKAKKQRIFESRVEGTMVFSKALSLLHRPPSVFISASAVGYYGDRGEELLHEGSAPGKGFLPRVATEAASHCLQNRGTRTVRTRFGMVIGNGGAIKKMRLPYLLGLGGKLGTGDQWVSWISLHDLIHAMDHILRTETLQGPINLVSPHPMRQKEFCQILAKHLRRTAFLTFPKPLLRFLFGSVANELLLASAHVIPRKLQESSFVFRYNDFQDALSFLH
ncbi:MAG: TIGR01777 family protein, partial [Chlamydiae bacterium]|nr:TIGR01777 family protein [Chlamydiota bacterium]